ncbi:hypothetical protein [Actinomadura sp. 6K520]|jgi:hypothetical protein|uniref:hypothetical protein n=1 Tax=Actinomadura sp. 6K520 TaxID=2530364 RepID=UPI001051B23F|nr:hypothetical protein [Actinomadura sp. 6K520]TDE30674.1 hypothetical protein E1289_18670 [Actinomadura sp. 6K520]
MADVTSEVRIIGSEGPGGLTLRTSGLSAGDLPELCVPGLPPYLGQGWARVLAALAKRLAASAGVPASITLGADVEISLTPAGDGVLAPGPPPGHDADGWHRDVLLRLFPEART